MRAPPRPRVAFVGLVCVDHIAEVPRCPDEDTEIRATSVRRCVGGNAANSARVAAALGIDAALLTTMASAAHPSSSSAFAAAALEECGVELFCDRIGAAIPTSFITVAANTASRTIVSCKSPLYRSVSFAAFESAHDVLLRARDDSGGARTPPAWLHFEGRDGDDVRRCVEDARCRAATSAATISLELEKVSAGRASSLVALLPLVDVAFVSSAFARHLGYANAAACVGGLRSALRCPGAVAVCAWGSAGAALGAAEGAAGAAGGATTTVHVTVADAVAAGAGASGGGGDAGERAVVDSVGAGDTFNAAFIAASLHGATRAEALSAAVRVATLKVRRRGFGGVRREQLAEGAWARRSGEEAGCCASEALRSPHLSKSEKHL